MAKKHYDEKRVLNELTRKGVDLNFSTRLITVNTSNGTVGIYSWGKIDFLVKHCDWRCICKSSEELKQEKVDAQKEYNANKKAAKLKAKEEKLKAAAKKENVNSPIKKGVIKAGKNMFKTLKSIKTVKK